MLISNFYLPKTLLSVSHILSTKLKKKQRIRKIEYFIPNHPDNKGGAGIWTLCMSYSR